MRNNRLLQQLLFVIVKLVGFQFETRSKSKVDRVIAKKAINKKNTTNNVGIYTRLLARHFHEELDWRKRTTLPSNQKFSHHENNLSCFLGCV